MLFKKPWVNASLMKSGSRLAASAWKAKRNSAAADGAPCAKQRHAANTREVKTPTADCQPTVGTFTAFKDLRRFILRCCSLTNPRAICDISTQLASAAEGRR